MKTHKVIDNMVPEFGGAEGVFAGTYVECHEWVAEQGYGYEVVPLTKEEMAWYKEFDK